MLNENDLSSIVVDSCLRIHRAVGPGLLESVYERLLAYELEKRRIRYERQVPVKVRYGTLIFECAFRADIIVQELVIVEIKSVEMVLPVHQKQLLTYLKLTNMKLGLLVNFNVGLIKNGITRIVNGL